MELKQATIITIQLGPFLDASDFVTPLTGLTPVAQLSKAGAVFVPRHDANPPIADTSGFYRMELDANDTSDIGILRIKCFPMGAVPVTQDYDVKSAANYDGSDGATAQQVWEYENRTLTMSNVSQDTNVDGQSPTLLLATVASSFEATVSGIDTANIDKLWFTIKRNADYSDQRSILQIEDPGGLLYLNAKVAAEPLDGSLTVVGSTVVIDIDVAAMSELEPVVQAIWDIKKLDTFGIATVLVSGYIQIRSTVTLSY